MTFAAWEGATECTGGPTPGARALMAGCLSAFTGAGARSLGIYNCRDVRGSSRRSCHAEGRACDVGFPLVGGAANPAGQRMLDALRAQAAGLGIQAMIYDRQIYSRTSPGGRPYAGASPHLDHVHIELTRSGGRDLTVATVMAAFGGAAAAASQEPAEDATGTVAPAERGLLVRGARGSAVRELQVLLGLADDGVFGSETDAAVRRFQAGRGLVPDGKVGPLTWSELVSDPD